MPSLSEPADPQPMLREHNRHHYETNTSLNGTLLTTGTHRQYGILDLNPTSAWNNRNCDSHHTLAISRVKVTRYVRYYNANRLTRVDFLLWSECLAGGFFIECKFHFSHYRLPVTTDNPSLVPLAQLIKYSWYATASLSVLKGDAFYQVQTRRISTFTEFFHNFINRISHHYFSLSNFW